MVERTEHPAAARGTQVARSPDTAHAGIDRENRAVGGQRVDQRRHVFGGDIACTTPLRSHDGHRVAQFTVDFQLTVEERTPGTLLQHGNQGLQGIFHVAGQPQLDAGAAADALGAEVHLRDAALLRQKTVVGKIRAQQQQ